MKPRQRLSALDSHLATENPGLLPVLHACRAFDRLLRRMALLPRGETLATRARWWPVIVALGPATPAKSAFLRGFLPSGGEPPADGRATLYGCAPARAGDPRLPAGLPDAVRVAGSDGPRLRGRLLLNAPDGAGLPVDALVERADLVLVFAAPGQPDAGAGTRHAVRSVSDLDAVEVLLADAEAAHRRRLAGMLDTVAGELEDELVPYLQAALARWRHGVRRGGLAWLGLLALALGGAVALGGTGNLPAFAVWLAEARPASLGGAPVRLLALAAGAGGLWLAGHVWVRRAVAQRVAADLPARMGEADLTPRRAFLRGTGLFRAGVAGWGRAARRRLAGIRAAARAESTAGG